jgi:DNA-binding response OmpR family regulator
MPSRLVVVDDDPVTLKVLRFLLEDEGYEVVTLARGSHVFDQVVGRETQLVLLDAGLPDLDGVALCQELRARGYHGPLIFLTGRGDLQAKLEGFRAGADDYVVKPYEPLELVARIQSVLRRFEQARLRSQGTLVRVADAELSVGELTYRSATVGPVLLTPTEMRILECLMREPHIVISRETLIARVWGAGLAGEHNRLDVYMRRLRHKIERDPARPAELCTVRGIGYGFRVALDRPTGDNTHEMDETITRDDMLGERPK